MDNAAEEAKKIAPKKKSADADLVAVNPKGFRFIKIDKNTKSRIIDDIKGFLLGLGRWVILIGVAYVIIGPVLGIISRSFFSDADNYNTMVYMIPQSPTTERYEIAFETLNYSSTALSTIIYSLTLMVLQVLMCSMVGYGFARYNFPFKKVLFACVVVMIVIPTHTIMLPLYMTFANFDVFGIFGLIMGSSPNLLGTVWPMYIMTFFGCGLRSGLYIYIFNQFFRGLPKEIEEAAYVDGCGVWYTYFRIMLRNAIPSAITVAIFSLVWQYNDTFYAKLFNISDSTLLSKRVATLASTVGNVYKIYDPNILQLYMDAGIVLVMLPLVVIYVVLQKQFIEGVERSGIVG
ncbi:MAG: carbohydrate ABC transporter permease [Lachnospiraceae bacterium]|nr:carbohydrate ABC transporter permease [Lachnospiraceae bacterium]